MKRVTITNPVPYVIINNRGKANRTLRTDANGFSARERKFPDHPPAEARRDSHWCELPAGSSEALGNAAHVAAELESAKSETVIPNMKLKVTPLKRVSGRQALVNDVFNRSSERDTII
jgi:hypothetical protein